ncbi:class I SAM-dependent methyltransferase [Fundidesulfovibrio terrae]|uniref:class I SAM-dependent methyltransferase n=1 Tax=Fundidesulfovibrio terrae TaxID=2922866 RepID=UPI001FAEED4B|nr:class I SAM-dependent methyltransferase [Fundidesulfovibrio terrae]
MASVYDAATAWALDPLRREVAALAVASGAGRALDVCCGTGRQCLFLHRAGVRATGLDISPAMLIRAARQPMPGELVLGDARRLPFPDAAFDFCSVALALHEKPPQARPAIMGEMLRVTRPGGMVAVVDYLKPDTAARGILALGVKAVERLAGREHHAYYAHFMAGGGLEGFLAGLGIAPVEIRWGLFGLIGIAVLRA